MYLEKIEIFGFKSFGDAVKIAVPSGITAIIGPNGSGKSNVADAIRWVLGEQSAKTLRGGKMEDVIFVGTETRKPMGYAEVALYIKNDEDDLKISYSDLEIKRRVYRSGESEYFINNANCRLRDIQEIFMDTGVGKEGYSIIGQGQIDKVLSSKPDDRRSLFEEATGIYKYKVKRQEASKKLEKERENILRANDIIAEIETRIKPLEKEVTKAERYLTVKEELKQVDIALFVEKNTQIDESLTQLNLVIEQQNTQISDTKKEKESLVKQDKQLKDQKEILQTNMEANLRETIELERQNATSNSELTIMNEKVKMLDEQIKEARVLKSTEETAIENITKGIAALKSDIAAISSVKAKQKTRLAVLVEEYNTFKVEKKAKEDAMAIEKDHIFTINKEIEVLKAELILVDQMKDNLKQRISKHQLENQDRELQMQKLEADTRELENQNTQLTSEADNIAVKISVAETEKTTLLETAQECEKLVATVENEKIQLERKKEWLLSLKENHDGFYTSVKDALKIGKTRGVGVVADRVDVVKGYEIAIATALGAGLQNVITETQRDAQEIITIMKKKKVGRVTFLPRDTIKAVAMDASIKANLKNQPGFLRMANEAVKCDAADEAIFSFMLGKIAIADTMENAAAIAKTYRHKFRVVTLEGEIFNIGGSLTGGSQKNTNNIFARNNEIANAEDRIEDLKMQIANAKQRLTGIMDLLATKTIALDKYRQSKDNIEKNLLQIFGAYTVASEKMTYMQKAIEQTDIVVLTEELDDLIAKRSDISAAIESKKALQLLRSVDTMEEEMQKLEQTQLEYTNQISIQEMDLYKIDNDIIDLERHITMNRTQIAQIDIAKIEETISQHIATKTAREKDALTIISVIAKVKNKLETTAQEKNKLERERVNITKNELNIGNKLRNVIELVAAIDKELIRQELRAESLVKEKSSLAEYILSEYNLIAENCFVKTDTKMTVADLKKKQTQLKSQIKEIGNVNLKSIEEFKEVSQRHVFLISQRDDILKAEKMLNELIEKLTAEMDSIFRKKFLDIATNFSNVFAELFGGGMAKLALTDEKNILESGIEIIVKPPGKKLQSLSLLSGGERTLTAIALLFAILQLKPSPFCVLDEIEAALDESNVLRFVNFLKTLSDKTQFIVITHRKGTMENANTLYGITQQERGVSTVLSVRLSDVDKYVKEGK
ncbi:chromosome segregation protein SMC [Candidatus Epulonipiscium viviparus]|uniref:chromosome segregation protein SMC n=1 Tax=Candidatus Epulonipiscium viviparus TaxID=420336 RepID=UPI002738104C|nr:chromosome segregation protein SMC [Candidatus Epulopiscium viviparus]